METILTKLQLNNSVTRVNVGKIKSIIIVTDNKKDIAKIINTSIVYNNKSYKWLSREFKSRICTNNTTVRRLVDIDGMDSSELAELYLMVSLHNIVKIQYILVSRSIPELTYNIVGAGVKQHIDIDVYVLKEK